MRQSNKDQIQYLLWQYLLWVIGILAIALLSFRYPENDLIKNYGPSLEVLFLGLLIGINIETKIKEGIIIRNKQKKFWYNIGPILIDRLESDLIQILNILYKMPFLDLNAEIINSENIDCSKLGKEFKKISEKLEILIIEDKENKKDKYIFEYCDSLKLFYDDIIIYVEDIQKNIEPLIFMHSENVNQIKTFLIFNGNLILIKEDLLKYEKHIGNDILDSSIKLFKSFNDICNMVNCINDERKLMLNAVNRAPS